MKRLILLALVGAVGLASSVAPAAANLELVLQTGHSAAVNTVALSADGKRVLTGSSDNSAILWDAQTGMQLRTFKGHSFGDSSVCLRSDGNRVLTRTTDKTLWLWDAQSGKPIQSYTCKGHTALIKAMSLSADGKRLVTVSFDKTAILWDAQSGEQLQSFKGHTDFVWAVDCSRDGKRIVTGSLDKTAILWDAQTGEQLQSFKGHTSAVYSVSLSGDGKRVVTGSGDKTTILWDAQTGKQLQSFKGHTGVVNSVSLSSDGKRVVTGSFDKTAILWDAQSGEQLQSFKGHTGAVNSVRVSGDGKRVLTGSADKTAILWDAQTGKPTQDFMGRTGSVVSLSVSADGRRILTSPWEKTAILWDGRTGRPMQAFKGHSDHLTSVSLSRDGKRALTGSRDNTAILWDGQTGSRLHSFPGPPVPLAPMGLFASMQGLTSVSLSGDGKRVLRAARDQTAILWDARTGKQLQVFKGHTWFIYKVSLNRDGSRAFTGSCNGSAILWDAQTGKRIQAFKCSSVNLPIDSISVSLSADGKLGVTGSFEGTVVLWDLEASKSLRVFKGHTGYIWAVDLSSDGRRVLSGSADNTAILWDAQTGKPIRAFKGHTDKVWSVRLSEDGKHAWTGSDDGTTRLWDTETGKELCSLISIDGDKDWLVITPEGLFDGSPNAPRFLSYRIAETLEFVPLERYQQKYYQPGLLSLLLKGNRPSPRIDITKSLPPKVRFTAPLRPGMAVEASQLDVKAVAETRGDFPVKAFRLLVDGRPYRGQLGIRKVGAPKLGESSASWSIELEPGKHTLKVLADTEFVQGATEEIEVRYTGGGIDKVELPALYVLAVGISKYPGTRRLDYAAVDARAVAKAYQVHSKPLFKNVEVKVVTDAEAGRKGVFAGLQWLRERMTQKSIGVFFFAGHGEKDKDGSLYFLPADFEEKDLAGSAIDADVLKKQLAGIPGRLTMILDACHSGDVGRGKTRGVGGLTDQLVRDLTAEESGLVVMCSALGSEQAQESHAHRHGLFTVALLEGLAGKATKSPDGAVYLTGLDAYVAARVRALSKGQQNPVTGKPTSVRDFPVSKP